MDPGKKHAIADALSRNPVFAAPNHKDIIVCKISKDIKDMALAELSKIASEDKDYREVVTTVLSGQYDGKLLRNLHKHHQTPPCPSIQCLMGLSCGPRNIPYIPRKNGRPGGSTPKGAF
jgi:hypothetical protein